MLYLKKCCDGKVFKKIDRWCTWVHIPYITQSTLIKYSLLLTQLLPLLQTFHCITNTEQRLKDCMKLSEREGGGDGWRGAACPRRLCKGDVISQNGIIQFLFLSQLEHIILCEQSKGACSQEHLRDCRPSTHTVLSEIHNTKGSLLLSDQLMELYVQCAS